MLMRVANQPLAVRAVPAAAPTSCPHRQSGYDRCHCQIWPGAASAEHAQRGQYHVRARLAEFKTLDKDLRHCAIVAAAAARIATALKPWMNWLIRG